MDARFSRDFSDFEKVYKWLVDHNPFDRNKTRLRSLASRIIANQILTCESSESVGHAIQMRIDNLKVCEVKIHRKESVVCLDTEKNKVDVGMSSISMNPTVLFTRLSTLAGRSKKSKQFFDFELTLDPMSLFKDGTMRKPDKSPLRNISLAKEVVNTNITSRVIDGCALF